jgi:hypothetical protein
MKTAPPAIVAGRSRLSPTRLALRQHRQAAVDLSPVAALELTAARCG